MALSLIILVLVLLLLQTAHGLTDERIAELVADCEQNEALWNAQSMNDRCYHLEQELICDSCDICWSGKKLLSIGDNMILSIEFVDQALAAYCQDNNSWEYYLSLLEGTQYANEGYYILVVIIQR